MKQLGSDAELSDREWRQMRRTLSKLEFEPVPETPPLLPRSAYDDSAKEEGEEADPATRNAADDDSRGSNHQESPTGRKRAMNDAPGDDSRSCEVECTSPTRLAKQISFELPSTSTSVFAPPPPVPVPLPPSVLQSQKSPSRIPRRANQDAMQPASTARSIKAHAVSAVMTATESRDNENDDEVIDIELHVAAAQDAIRQSVTTAIKDIKARLVRESNLERMKTAAAHANDVAMLQRKIEELKELVVQSDANQSHRRAILERYSAFTAQRAQQSRAYWSKAHSVASCFQAWRALKQAKATKSHAQRAASRLHKKQSQKTHFQAWKQVSQQSQFMRRVHNLQVEHERHLVETVNEYQLKIEQLQQELDESKRQVAVSQKARQRLEDDLRQVFLRGVSAMNIEALTLFNSNHETKRDGGSDGNPCEEQSAQSDLSSGHLRTSLSSNDENEIRAENLTHRSYSDSYGPTGERADWSRAGAADDAERTSPEILTRQPTPREDLNVKLKEMLASSTSRLETSLSSNRSMPEKRNGGYNSSNTHQHAPRSQNSSFHRTSSTPSANLLRSAEMVQQQMYGAASSTVPQTRSFEASLAFQTPVSFNKPKAKQPTPSTKYQVEMEYIRSTVTAGRSTNGSLQQHERPAFLQRRAWTRRRQASMSRTHAQIDLRRPFYSAEDDEDEEEDEGGGRGNGFSDEDDQSFATEAHASRRFHRHDEEASMMVDEDEEVDLEGYEQYLAELKSKAEARPHSARVLRTLPTESPQFYMVNAHNPSFPVAPPPLSSCPTTAAANASRPTRPMSARPRLNTAGSRTNAPSSSSSAAQLPRAPSRSNLTMGTGVRRRRQDDNVLNARVRAIYNDTTTSRAPPAIRQMPSSVAANSTIANKLKVFQQAELHDEYYKLVDVVTELKSACQLEQERRVKAVARIRRLEEIVAMKDRKIEALLHTKSSGGSDYQSHMAGGGLGITQRELAHKDRQTNALVLKLKHKIAQQSQMLGSYEEAMQSLRSGIKSTNLMELEEERAQLYVDIRNQQELLTCARLELESQNKKINELFQIDGHHRQQITKLQQENRRGAMEKQKSDQEIVFFKTRIEQLQDKLALEQRKRTYDREISSNNGAAGGSSGELLNLPASRSSVLANALEEMKTLMKKESLASIQREKLKSPRPAVASKSPRNIASNATPAATATGASSSQQTPSVAAQSPAQPPAQRQMRPQSAGPTRPHRAMGSSIQSKTPSSSTSSQVATPSKQSNGDASAKLVAPVKQEIESAQPLEHQPKDCEPSGAVGGDNSATASELIASPTPQESMTSSSLSSGTLRDGDAERLSQQVQPSELPANSEPSAKPSSADKDAPRVELGEELAAVSRAAPPEERKAMVVDTVASENEAQPISDNGTSVENHVEAEPSETHANAADPALSHISSPPLSEPGQVKATANVSGFESEKLDSEEQNRQKIAELSRLLQEMGDDEDAEERGLLASDSSEEFLNIAELQRELHNGHDESREKEKQQRSSSSSASSSSEEETSPLPHSLSQPAAPEDGEAAIATTLVALQTPRLLAQSEEDDNSEEGNVVAAAASSGSAELLYDSDFTEDGENENEDDESELGV